MNNYYKLIGRNIERQRKLKKISAEELGNRVGLTKKTIRRYETGDIRILFERVMDIAKALEVDPKVFYEDTALNLYPPIETVKEFTSIPIVGSISCGNGILAFEDIEDYEDIPSSWLNGGEYFFLRAKGDSMINARIYDGDLLLIRRQETVENGEIAAVFLNGEAVLKRVYKTDGTLILQSENPKYKPIIVKGDENTKVIGRLKKVVLDF